MADRISCVINRHDQLGETPLWCRRTGKLWWLDIEKPRLQSFDPDTGAHQAFPFAAKYAGSLFFHGDGKFLVALDNSLFAFDPDASELEHFIDIEPPNRGTRLNDGRCDRHGRLWIGTMDEEFNSPLGSVYRVGAGGSLDRIFGDMIVTNSIVTSPDDRVLYVSDTRRYVMWAFDLDPDDGVVSNRRVFADYTGARGRPDGSCIDADGCIWNAAFAGGCVIRYAPSGKIDRVIDLPVTNPTCVCLGDSDFRTLYVTTATKMIEPARLPQEPLAGAVLALRVDVAGLPEPVFGRSFASISATRSDGASAL